MLWPPPMRGERVTLRCGCYVTVKWRVSVAFLYRLVIDRKEDSCARHRSGRSVFAGLEDVASRAPTDRLQDDVVPPRDVRCRYSSATTTP